MSLHDSLPILFDRSFPDTDSNASPPEAGPSPLREAVMSQGRFVFTHLVQHLPLHTFRRLVAKYDGQRYVKRFSCLDQFLCMAFAQLTGRESLRDIELCLRAHQTKLFHLGIRGRVARSTLADANERDRKSTRLNSSH